ncbi:MAG: NERD domain-containing protein [Clostridia bacterium]|nr:NERD domain-containing protein [Clostridia bacterium]
MDPNVLLILCIGAGVLILFIAIVLIFSSKGKRYTESQYYKVTGNTKDDLRSDSGKTGEYNIYAALREYEDKGAKFLFNVYIPMAKGGTTELDAVMICSKGIIVFESKSRYGWLEGNERDKYWSQFLFRANGALIENKLYNPILQNRGHIVHLKTLLGGNVRMWSVIVFSEKTDIKRICVSFPDTCLTTDSDLKRVVGNIYWNAKDTLTANDITSIYFKLYQYTRVSDEDKQKHIRYIKKTYVNRKPPKGKAKYKRVKK